MKCSLLVALLILIVEATNLVSCQIAAIFSVGLAEGVVRHCHQPGVCISSYRCLYTTVCALVEPVSAGYHGNSLTANATMWPSLGSCSRPVGISTGQDKARDFDGKVHDSVRSPRKLIKLKLPISYLILHVELWFDHQNDRNDLWSTYHVLNYYRKVIKYSGMLQVSAWSPSSSLRLRLKRPPDWSTLTDIPQSSRFIGHSIILECEYLVRMYWSCVLLVNVAV